MQIGTMGTISGPTDNAKVAAEYRDGVLTLTMPKREEVKPKTIKVNVSEK